MNKKKFINTAKAVLAGMVVMFGMTSCGNDDNVTTPKTANEFEGLDLTLTYSVGEAQNDSVFTRGMATRPMTEKHTFMGMEGKRIGIHVLPQKNDQERRLAQFC